MCRCLDLQGPCPLHVFPLFFCILPCLNRFLAASTLKQSQHFILLVHCFASAYITLFPGSISQRLSFSLCLVCLFTDRKPTNPLNYTFQKTLKHIPDLTSTNSTHLAIISGVSSVSCFVTVVLKELPLEIQYDFTVLTTKELRHYE